MARLFSSSPIGNALAGIADAMSPSASDLNTQLRAQYLAAVTPAQIERDRANAAANRALAEQRAAQTTARGDIGDIILRTLPQETVPEFGPEVPSGPIGTVMVPGMDPGEAFTRAASAAASAGLGAGELEALMRTMTVGRPAGELSADTLRRFNAIYGDPVAASEATTAEELVAIQAADQAKALAVQDLRNRAPTSVAAGATLVDPTTSTPMFTAPRAVTRDPGEGISIVGSPAGVGNILVETPVAPDPAAARAAGSGGSGRTPPQDTLASTNRVEDRIVTLLQDMEVEGFDIEAPGTLLNDITQRARRYQAAGLSEADAPTYAIRDFTTVERTEPMSLPFGFEVGGGLVSTLRETPLPFRPPSTPQAAQTGVAAAEEAAPSEPGSSENNPVPITTQAEYDALDPGVYFVDPVGTVGKKPEPSE